MVHTTTLAQCGTIPLQWMYHVTHAANFILIQTRPSGRQRPSLHPRKHRATITMCDGQYDQSRGNMPDRDVNSRRCSQPQVVRQGKFRLSNSPYRLYHTNRQELKELTSC